MDNLRALPSVDRLLQTGKAAHLTAFYGRTLTVEAVRAVLEDARYLIRSGKQAPVEDDLLDQAGLLLKSWLEPTLKPVINATGVILHTNLGRAPLSKTALEEIHRNSGGYATLELDLSTGKRGSRSAHAETLLKRLTGAESALVVNNNAAAVLLVLTALARRRRVAISRTQLVEIGGGFRVPEVMAQSGARLVEVGATNRVYIDDYETVLREGVNILFHAHASNYRIVGFTSEPYLGEIADLAKRYGALLLEDLGSGTLLDTSRYGLMHEPTVQESLAAGADIVCFSGDKLLGGPQAGIIVGRAELVAKIKKHPLARAVRADKLCLAALGATLGHYLKGEAEKEIPIWRMIAASTEEICQRAFAWKKSLGTGEVISGLSTIGGGSLPEETLQTSLLAMATNQPDLVLARLRKLNPPIIARVEEGQLVFDPRTVLPDFEEDFLMGLKKIFGG